MMPVGPVELLVVKFPGNQFTGELAPELTRLVESGTINVIDLVFIHKDADGNTNVVELNDLSPEESTPFTQVVREQEELIGDDDIWRFAALLEPNSSAGLLLFENAWAATFAHGLRNAGAEVILNERIPYAVIEDLVAETA
jgi:hypothetical protein